MRYGHAISDNGGSHARETVSPHDTHDALAMPRYEIERACMRGARMWRHTVDRDRVALYFAHLTPTARKIAAKTKPELWKLRAELKKGGWHPKEMETKRLTNPNQLPGNV